MRAVEQKLRRFRAAFFVSVGFANWVRTRALELEREGQPFEIVLCWGARVFRVDALPEDDPFFAIERADGTLERSPWVDVMGLEETLDERSGRTPQRTLYTTKQKQIVVRAYMKGRSAAEVAAQYHVPENYVYKWAAQLGGVSKVAKSFDETKAVAREIQARTVQKLIACAWQAARGFGLERDEFLELCDEGTRSK